MTVLIDKRDLESENGFLFTTCEIPFCQHTVQATGTATLICMKIQYSKFTCKIHAKNTCVKFYTINKITSSLNYMQDACIYCREISSLSFYTQAVCIS